MVPILRVRIQSVAKGIPLLLGPIDEVKPDSSWVLDWSEWAASLIHGVNPPAKIILVHSPVCRP